MKINFGYVVELQLIRSWFYDRKRIRYFEKIGNVHQLLVLMEKLIFAKKC